MEGTQCKCCRRVNLITEIQLVYFMMRSSAGIFAQADSVRRDRDTRSDRCGLKEMLPKQGRRNTCYVRFHAFFAWSMLAFSA